MEIVKACFVASGESRFILVFKLPKAISASSHHFHFDRIILPASPCWHHPVQTLAW
jgi:hypothetical protein